MPGFLGGFTLTGELNSALKNVSDHYHLPYLPVYNARPCIIRTLIFDHIFWKKTQTKPKVYLCKIMFIELTTTGK